MKSGTTSLHDYLNEHPDISMSNPKEIHYYADEYYSTKPLEWYHAFLNSSSKLVGTSPQSYTKRHNKYYQHIPERIRKHNPDVKLIYIVRDPLKRMESHVLESYHCDPISDIRYSKTSDNYLNTSLYFYQISAYLDHFPRNQIKVVSMEELVNDKLSTMNSLFHFLGVTPMQDESIFEYESNTAFEKGVPFFIRSLMPYRIIRKLSFGVVDKFVIWFLKLFVPRLMQKPKLSQDELDRVLPLLKSDVEKFRKFTGKEFSEWSI